MADSTCKSAAFKGQVLALQADGDCYAARIAALPDWDKREFTGGETQILKPLVASYCEECGSPSSPVTTNCSVVGTPHCSDQPFLVIHSFRAQPCLGQWA
jgi:hypothetical protein